jgi:hypothetical protein
MVRACWGIGGWIDQYLRAAGHVGTAGKEVIGLGVEVLESGRSADKETE